MNLKKPIASGRTAKVYDWDKHQIVKLFKPGWTNANIEYEYNISKKVFDLGLQVPEVFEIVEYKNQKGIVYEKLEGRSMLKVMTSKPFKIRHYGKKLAELAYTIHEKQVEGLPNLYEKLKKSIHKGNHLTIEEKGFIENKLNLLENDKYLCHGDFHPDNIIITKNGPVIIDWMTVSQGNPIADFARTSLLLQIGTPPSGIVERTLTNIFRSIFYKSFFNKYVNLSDVITEELKGWKLPIAVNRLNSDSIPEEREQLLKLIREAIND